MTTVFICNLHLPRKGGFQTVLFPTAIWRSPLLDVTTAHHYRDNFLTRDTLNIFILKLVLTRGNVLGSFAFAVFFLVVGAMLLRYRCAAAYSIAAIISVAVNVTLLSCRA
jgi:hypothetical protein